MRIASVFLGLALWSGVPASADDADWPTWRHDAMRSGASPHSLPGDLRLQWTRDLGKPDPAFDYHFRLCADQTYEPVSSEGLVFVPSNSRDSVTAYELTTGEERWHFLTEGPVRFAPVAEAGSVWFVADDGFLYCVDAGSGALRWKTRGAPADRTDHRMLVNGRMCSRWPARGGPLLVAGTIYFGCGIWPSEGVFVVAVDAATGVVKWRNGEIAQIDDGLEEHGRLADIGLPPHGYLALIGGRIALASGRAIAAFLDPDTGELAPYNSFYSKGSESPRGAWALASNADFWFQGGSLYGTSAALVDRLPTGPLPVADFAKLCGKDLGWVEKRIADRTVRTKQVGGKRLVLFDPRTPAISLFPVGKKQLSANQKASVLDHPPVQVPLLATRHEIGDVTPPVFTPTRMFRNEYRTAKELQVLRGETHVGVPGYGRIAAYDLASASWNIELSTGWIRKGPARFARQLRFDKVWEIDGALTARIAAGDRLFATGKDRIVALDVTGGSGRSRIVWEAATPGVPVSAIAARGHLIVTTDRGIMMCFGVEKSDPRSFAAPAEPVEPDPAWGAPVKQWTADQRELGGFALVCGWHSGGLVRELVRRTRLSVLILESDVELAAKAREQLHAADLLGVRAQVIQTDLRGFQLAPYFAELVVSEDFNTLGQPAMVWTRTAMDALRPFTGRAWLRLRPKLLAEAEAHAKRLGGYSLAANGRLTAVRRLRAPDGADDWTHETATAGNTFASADALAVPPFGLLWYSGGIDRSFTPAFEYQHNRNPYPVISDGRMFLIAAAEVNAVDAYTGRHLWKATIPESARTRSRLEDHRIFSPPADRNVIATPDRLYVIREADARVLDTATGRLLGVLEIPDESKPGVPAPWNEARVSGDQMLIASGGRILAVDRTTGALHWRHDTGREQVAFTAGGGRVYAVGYTTKRGRSNLTEGAFRTQIEVLDLADGHVIATAPLAAPGRPEQSNRVPKGGWSVIFSENPLRPTLAYNRAHDVVIAVLDRHEYFGLTAKDARLLWHRDVGGRLADLVTFEPPTVTSELVVCDDGRTFDVRTGEPAGPEALGGRGTGCNRFLGSDALVTFRSALACVVDLKTAKRTYLSSTRSGCTNGMIPAGGLLNAPNFAHGCVCNYPFLTSFALYHLPAAARWAPAKAPDVQLQRNPNAE